MAGILAIVQARVSSQRLPRKVLLPLNGRPSICHVMDRVSMATKVNEVVLATSIMPSNDSLCDLAVKEDWEYVRGEEHDVVSRFATLIEQKQPDMVVRVCADNFAIVPEVIDGAIERCINRNLDICNPFLRHTYPFGVGAEVATTDAFQRVERETCNEPIQYREHIFSWAYLNSDKFRVDSLPAPLDCTRPDVRVSVDTLEDLERVETIYSQVIGQEKYFDVQDIINIWDRLDLGAT